MMKCQAGPPHTRSPAPEMSKKNFRSLCDCRVCRGQTKLTTTTALRCKVDIVDQLLVGNDWCPGTPSLEGHSFFAGQSLRQEASAAHAVICITNYIDQETALCFPVCPSVRPSVRPSVCLSVCVCLLQGFSNTSQCRSYLLLYSGNNNNYCFCFVKTIDVNFLFTFSVFS